MERRLSVPATAGALRLRVPDSALLAALAGALLLLGAAGARLEPWVRPAATDAALSGAGWEARRWIAQFLWLKIHAVLHAGAEERRARPGEAVTRAAELHLHGGEPGSPHEHEGEGYVLVIPPRHEDFRGLLGDLERAVKPYAGADGRLYSKDADQTIPFYRLLTWLDPHFVQGYTVGANMICRAGRYPEQGLAFLREGERHNPDSFEIQVELGHFHLVYWRDWAAAERHLRRALALVPRGRRLTDVEEDARADAYRWLALTYREWGRREEAVRVAREGLAVLGHDGVLEHVIARGGRRPPGAPHSM